MKRRTPLERQRGEGKVGCTLTLLVFGILVAIGLKVVPVYYANSELVDACKFIASSASRLPLELVEKQTRDKARELGMRDVLSQKDAITVSKDSTGMGDPGTCTIRLRYKQTIDLYGVYQFDIVTNKTITEPILENIS
ncbi:MAG TPA: hypothetical protein VF768_11120 [Holophagaceae bacterium]